MNLKKLFVIGLAAALALSIVACGPEEELEVREGEAIEVGELEYFVKLTRFLNPDDTEDKAYLEGAPKNTPGKQYLGVFLTVENTTDEEHEPSRSITIVDTRETRYEAIALPSSNNYTLPFERIPSDEIVPPPGSPAESGPIKGALLLFSVDERVVENRPLELEIPGGKFGEAGRVELDI